MERTLCVWFPDWPLRLLESPPPPDEPYQAVGSDNRVAAVNPAAATAGVALGMSRREAEGVCPTVTTIVRDLGAEAVAFEEVARAVEDLVPRIELAEPGLLFVPVTGAVRYYGGEEPLVERLCKEVERVAGPGAHLGLAAGPFAARMAADHATDAPYIVDDDAAFVESLDLSTVAPDDLVDTFRWLGISTLGELAHLPRPAVLSRFGPEGLTAHRLASGEDRAAMTRPIPDDLAVEERFSPPLESLEQAAFVARALSVRLIEELARYGAMPHRVEVEGESSTGVVRNRVWRSADPFGDTELAERVRWQLGSWVEGEGIVGGLVRLRLAPADLSDEGRQLALHEDAVALAEAQRSLLRAQSLAGPDAVLASQPQGGRDPADQVLWRRWGEEASPARDTTAPWPGRLPGPAPALVPTQPPALDVEWEAGTPTRVRLGSRWEPILSWAGPWRRMGKWWEGEGHCDRYQLVTSVGAFLVEVAADGVRLTGVYD
ncbi:MAG: DNA polymerase Y family protein [Acidimicrobiia bacterium]